MNSEMIRHLIIGLTQGPEDLRRKAAMVVRNEAYYPIYETQYKYWQTWLKG